MQTYATPLSLLYYHPRADQPHRMAGMRPAWAIKQVSSLTQLLDHALAYPPTVVFLSSNTWSDTMLDTARLLHQRLPHPLIVMQMPVSRCHLAALWRAHAAGYLCPEAIEQEVNQCLNEVLLGGCYLCSTIHTLLNCESEAADILLLSRLSLCEWEVMVYMAQGLKAASIAQRLCRSEGTIKKHNDNIVKKLGLEGRASLYRFAERMKAYLESKNTPKE